MQCLARKLAQHRGTRMDFAAVHRISHQRVADRFEMHADLMGTTRVQLALEQGSVTETFEYAEISAGRFASGVHRHARALYRVAPDRLFYGSASGDYPVCKRKVPARYTASLQVAAQAGVASQCPRTHQQSAGVLVEPVDDARPGHAGKVGTAAQ